MVGARIRRSDGSGQCARVDPPAHSNDNQRSQQAASGPHRYVCARRIGCSNLGSWHPSGVVASVANDVRYLVSG